MRRLDSSDAEIDALQALCDRLAGFDDRISVEWLDGCMAALIAGPRTVLPGEWLPLLLGDAWERTFADPPDVEQAMRTLMARWNVIASQLDPEALFDAPDELRLSPLLTDCSPETRDALLTEGRIDADEAADWPLSGEAWAAGFLQAVQAFAGDWDSAPPDDDSAAWLEGGLRAIAALVQRDPAALEADLKSRYPGQQLDRDDLVDEACIAAQDLRCYWIEHAPRPATRRVEPKPGRNDPCPCGSGRKYKKCHGAG